MVSHYAPRHIYMLIPFLIPVILTNKGMVTKEVLISLFIMKMFKLQRLKFLLKSILKIDIFLKKFGERKRILKINEHTIGYWLGELAILTPALPNTVLKRFRFTLDYLKGTAPQIKGEYRYSLQQSFQYGVLQSVEGSNWQNSPSLYIPVVLHFPIVYLTINHNFALENAIILLLLQIFITYSYSCRKL